MVSICHKRLPGLKERCDFSLYAEGTLSNWSTWVHFWVWITDYDSDCNHEEITKKRGKDTFFSNHVRYENFILKQIWVNFNAWLWRRLCKSSIYRKSIIIVIKTYDFACTMNFIEKLQNTVVGTVRHKGNKIQVSILCVS